MSTPLTVEFAIEFDRRDRGSRKVLRVKPETPPAPLPARVPRVARLLALALRFERLVREESVRDFAELARLGRVTRARLSQIMSLVHLAPDIQEQVLFLLPVEQGREPIILRQLTAIARHAEWARQRRLWSRLAAEAHAA